MANGKGRRVQLSTQNAACRPPADGCKQQAEGCTPNSTITDCFIVADLPWRAQVAVLSKETGTEVVVLPHDAAPIAKACSLLESSPNGGSLSPYISSQPWKVQITAFPDIGAQEGLLNEFNILGKEGRLEQAPWEVQVAPRSEPRSGAPRIGSPGGGGEATQAPPEELAEPAVD